MALVTVFEAVEKYTHRVHPAVRATAYVLEDGAEKYVQIDTFGSPDLKKEDPTQSIQLNEAAAKQLLQIIKGTFPALR